MAASWQPFLLSISRGFDLRITNGDVRFKRKNKHFAHAFAAAPTERRKRSFIKAQKGATKPSKRKRNIFTLPDLLIFSYIYASAVKRNGKHFQNAANAPTNYLITFLNRFSLPVKGGYFMLGSNQVGVFMMALRWLNTSKLCRPW